MLIYIDLLTGKEVGTDSFPNSIVCPGIIALESKRITVTETEVNIGANASTEAEEDESHDAPESKTVINIVHASTLQKVDLAKKDFKAIIGQYFKKILGKLNEMKIVAVGLKPEDEPSKEDETDAASKLEKYDRIDYDNCVAKVAKYKENFSHINKWVMDEVLKNFEEFEFYTCEEGELGSCMLIPARYIGESTAPVFYLFAEGIREQKA